MYSAPSVTFPVGRSRFQALLTLGVVLLGAGVCAFWSYSTGRFEWPQVLALGSWLLTSGIAFWGWNRTHTGLLRWDGQHWSFESAAGVLQGQVLLRLDLQSWMVLEFRVASARSSWLWLERGMQTQRWEGLRRAVCARAGAASGQAADLSGGRV